MASPGVRPLNGPLGARLAARITPPHKRWATAWLIIIALALLLRLFRADAQSLWYDEGTSAQLALRSVHDIVAAAAGDIHPPLYYLILAAWSRAFGHTVIALRALSALCGAAMVVAVLVAARRWFGTAVASVAGILAAVSPLLVWYGQEVRMYILAGLLGALLVAVVLVLDARFDTRPGMTPDASPDAWRWWALYALLATAALYTQYLAGAAAIACGLAVAAVALVRRAAVDRRDALRRAVRFAAVNTVPLVLFAPWLVRAWPALRDWPALGAPVGLLFVAREAVITYAFGIKAPPAWQQAWPWLAAAAVAGAAVGLGPWARQARRWATAGALAWAAAPPVLVWAASLRRPAWNPKFIIAGAPGFELLLALAVIGVAEAVGTVVGRHCPIGSRRTWAERNAALAAGALALALIAWPRLAVWHANAYDPAYQRDNYKGIAAEIAARAGPEDAVVLNAPTQVEVFGFYDRGAHATYPLPVGRPVDVAATEAELAGLLARQRDIFAVLWATGESDPDGIVEARLNAHRYKAEDRWFGNVRLATWVKAREPSGRPLNGSPVVFGDAIEMLECIAAPARPDTGADGANGASGRPLVVDVRAGEHVTLDIVWRALRPIEHDYVVFVQLVDSAGRMIVTRDMRPHGGMSATSAWRPVPAGAPLPFDSANPDGPVLDLIALRVPPNTPPGDGYRLVLGLYDPATGQRLAPDTGGDAFEVATVTVRPR